MWNSLRKLSSALLEIPKYDLNFNRTVFVVERIYTPKLNKLGAVHKKKLRKKDFYYRLVEDTDVKKKPELDLVLLKDVPGIGLRGEQVKINCFIGYRDLLLPKLAVYADSEEAQELIQVKDDTVLSSKYSKIVEKYITGNPLSIVLHSENPWVLEPWHVKFALRKKGILANDHCIVLPEKQISGPNFEIENKDFIVNLVMNKSEVFPLRCRIYLSSSSKNVDFDSQLLTTSQPLFPEQQEQINNLLKIESDLKKIKQASQQGNAPQGKLKRKKKLFYGPVGAANRKY